MTGWVTTFNVQKMPQAVREAFMRCLAQTGLDISYTYLEELVSEWDDCYGYDEETDDPCRGDCYFCQSSEWLQRMQKNVLHPDQKEYLVYTDEQMKIESQYFMEIPVEEIAPELKVNMIETLLGEDGFGSDFFVGKKEVSLWQIFRMYATGIQQIWE